MASHFLERISYNLPCGGLDDEADEIYAVGRKLARVMLLGTLQCK